MAKHCYLEGFTLLTKFAINLHHAHTFVVIFIPISSMYCISEVFLTLLVAHHFACICNSQCFSVFVEAQVTFI